MKALGGLIVGVSFGLVTVNPFGGLCLFVVGAYLIMGD